MKTTFLSKSKDRLQEFLKCLSNQRCQPRFRVHRRLQQWQGIQLVQRRQFNHSYELMVLKKTSSRTDNNMVSQFIQTKSWLLRQSFHQKLPFTKMNNSWTNNNLRLQNKMACLERDPNHLRADPNLGRDPNNSSRDPNVVRNLNNSNRVPNLGRDPKNSIRDHNN